jgi:hypothetical protein
MNSIQEAWQDKDGYRHMWAVPELIQHHGILDVPAILSIVKNSSWIVKQMRAFDRASDFIQQQERVSKRGAEDIWISHHQMN